MQLKKLNSPSADREAKMDISSCRRNSQACKLETQNVQPEESGGKFIPEPREGAETKDADGEEGTGAKPSGKSNSPRRLRTGQFQRIKRLEAEQIQIQKGAGQAAKTMRRHLFHSASITSRRQELFKPLLMRVLWRNKTLNFRYFSCFELQCTK